MFSELLTELDLSDIEAENRGRSEQEKRIACLRKWKTRNGSRAKYADLVGSALKGGMLSNAEAICRTLLGNDSGNTDSE